MTKMALRSTYIYTSIDYYVQLLSKTNLDDVQTLEAVLWKHLYLHFHILTLILQHIYKNFSGYFSKEKGSASGFMVV